MANPSNEPCKTRAQDVQDCLTNNNFSVKRCFNLMAKLQSCYRLNSYLQSIRPLSSSAVASFTAEPVLDGGIPRKENMNQGIFCSKVYITKNQMMLSFAQDKKMIKNLSPREEEDKNKLIFLSKLHVGHDGTTLLLYVKDKNLINRPSGGEENKGNGIFISRAWIWRKGVKIFFFEEMKS